MHRTAYLSLLALAVSLASANVRGAEETGNAPVTEERAPRTSNMESWQDEEEERKGSWTWFGMGYESRRSATSVIAPGGGGTGGSTGGGGGKGGPGGRKP